MKKINKVLFSIVCCFILVFSGANVTFANSATDVYAESDEEIEGKIQNINKIIKENNEKMIIEVQMLSLNQDTKAKLTKTINSVKRLEDLGIENNNLDFDTELKSKNVDTNSEFSKLCLEIKNYKENNPNVDIKSIVKYFNKKAGLKEKSQKKIVEISLGQKVNALSYSDWSSLTTSEKLLIASDPINAALTYAAKDKAFSLTNAKFGYNGLGDKSDAFRHGIWNAIMARDCGKTWALLYGTAHEDKSTVGNDQDGYPKQSHKQMDLNNNRSGVDCVYWYDIYPSNSTLSSRVSSKLTNKSYPEMYWLHN